MTRLIFSTVFTVIDPIMKATTSVNDVIVMDDPAICSIRPILHYQFNPIKKHNYYLDNFQGAVILTITNLSGIVDGSQGEECSLCTFCQQACLILFRSVIN